MKKAFTLLELIIVMVVLGIVSMISAEIIASIYERYVINRTIDKLESKTELTLDIIGQKLQYRIKESVIARKNKLSNDIKPLANADDSYKILEWIGYDHDGLLGDSNGSFNIPGWDGFVDLIPSDGTQIVSPGSHFMTIEDGIIKKLSTKVALDGSKAHLPAIVFKGTRGELEISKFGWDWTSTEHNYTIRVSSSTEDKLQLLEKPSFVSERYYISWSAFAFVPEGTDCNATDNKPKDCNLTLYFDYQPWENEKFSNGKGSLLVDHISTFRFRQVGNAIHIKLCTTDPTMNRYMNDYVSLCKERIIY